MYLHYCGDISDLLVIFSDVLALSHDYFSG